MNKPPATGESYGSIENYDELRPIKASFSLALNPDIEHYIGGTTGRQYLSLGDEVPYPEHGLSTEIEEIILPPAFIIGDNKERWLLLPDNYVTMTQALNDSIGDQATGRSHEMAHDLFAELGAQLAHLAARDKVLPQTLTHRQVVFLRDESGFKLTPPLVLEEFESMDEAKEKCLTSLRQSCIQGAATLIQLQQVLEAFKGFEDSFTGE